jgi:hypothetical protein
MTGGITLTSMRGNMKMKVFARAISVCAVLAAISPPAFAGSATATLSITVQAPLAVVFTPSSPTEACSTAAGTVVSALSVTGGDGNTVTWSISGDTTDFALSGANIVVGPNGITSADCGKIDTVTVTATQQ